MNIDSQMCEYVVSDFVKRDVPILTVHDSFIVPLGEEDNLNRLMKEAFNEVTNSLGIKVKYNENLTKTQLYAHGTQDRNWFLDMIDYLRKGNSTKGYLGRWNRHKLAFGKK